MTLGEKIRDLRRMRQITQRELAAKIQNMGLRADFTYISKIENDRTEILPSEELLRALAKILNTDAEELLDLAGKFNQKELQQVVSDTPSVGILLRRIQSGKIPQEQIKRWLNETGGESNEN